MKVHFIGENGVSMARLKALTLKLGHDVTGSDERTTGHSEDNVRGVDMVVYSGAVKSDNCELLYALQNGIPAIERSKFLSAIASGYNRVIAIAGSHGKTTVTAMVATALGSLCPTVHIGASYDYALDEQRDLFISEACEYRKSLLELSPDLGVVLNVELDHTDCYGSVDEIVETFALYAHKCKTALINGDDKRLLANVHTCAYTFGFGLDNDYRLDNLAPNEYGGISFDYYANDKYVNRVNLKVKGEHNALNALCALAVADIYKIPF